MNSPSQNTYLGSNPNPGSDNYSPGASDLDRKISNGPAQRQPAYSPPPYLAQGSQTALQPQIQSPNSQQNTNFQHNHNFQQNPNLQQGQSLQQISYPQQTSTISMLGPHSQQEMGPPTRKYPCQRFIVLSKSDSLSSGFPFHPQLYDLQVTHDEWHQFTSEIIDAAKLSASEDAAAWAAGVTSGAASTAFLLFFGPAVGYYSGKAIHKRVVVKKVKERLLENGDIWAVLNKWNQGTFKTKGFHVWLECPTDFIKTLPKKLKSPPKVEKETQRFQLMIFPSAEIEEPFPAAPWSQAQPGLVEAPSVAPQRPEELQNTPAHNVPLQNEDWKESFPPSVAQIPATTELDAQQNRQGSHPLPAELEGLS